MSIRFHTTKTYKCTQFLIGKPLVILLDFAARIRPSTTEIFRRGSMKVGCSIRVNLLQPLKTAFAIFGQYKLTLFILFNDTFPRSRVNSKWFCIFQSQNDLLETYDRSYIRIINKFSLSSSRRRRRRNTRHDLKISCNDKIYKKEKNQFLFILHIFLFFYFFSLFFTKKTKHKTTKKQ